MAKIKGWTKKRNNLKFETWENDKEDSIYLEIYKSPKTKEYFGSIFIVEVVNPITYNKIGKNFYNYKEAKKFAIDYMRSNPNG